MKTASFAPLTVVLDGRFNKPSSRLRKKLRERVEQDFFPWPWDQLTAEQRQSVAAQLDYQQDPACEAERADYWALWIRHDELLWEVAEWKSAATPTALDKAARDGGLRGAQDRLAAFEREHKLCHVECAAGNVPSRTRIDRMSEEIGNAIQELGSGHTPQLVMGKLKSYVGKPGSYITQSVGASVTWKDEHEREHNLDMDALRKRLDRRRKG